MNALMLLLLSTPLLAETGAAVTIGGAFPLGLNGSLYTGNQLRSQLEYGSGNLRFGPVLQVQHHNGAYYNTLDDCYASGVCILGDMRIFGLGAHVTQSIELGAFVLRPTLSALLEHAGSPMSRDYMESEVLPLWGVNEPLVGPSELLMAADIGLDFLIPMWKGGPAFLMNTSASYHTRIGAMGIMRLGFQAGH